MARKLSAAVCFASLILLLFVSQSSAETYSPYPENVMAGDLAISGEAMGLSGLVRFSDYPEDTEEADIEEAEAEQDPDDISTHEILNAYDAAMMPDEDSLAEEPAAVSFFDLSMDGPGHEMLDPFTLYSQELKDPVGRNIELFSVKMKERFSMWLARSGRYVGMMQEILRENGLPEDLVYLALIESGFNPKAYSWAKASGPWQFISGTGKKYGLKIDWWVDERRDPVKSTRAAARYLTDLYDMFGTWELAMASYNAGEGKMSRAVKRLGTLDYWEIRKTRYIRRETKEYVPRYLAAKIIANNPATYGLDNIEYQEPFAFDEVTLNAPTGLEVAAKCAGVSVDEIKALNPELRRWCTPPNCSDYTLRVPKGTKEAFLAKYAKLPESEKAGWSEYIVRRGDTLGRIASKYNVPLSVITKANKINRVSLISVGQRIIIPMSGAQNASYGGGPAYADYADYETETTTYRVRRGDTLGRIAKRFRTSVSKIARLNGISNRTTIYPGQKLKVSGTASASYASSAESSGGTYKVRRGDTLNSIARKFRTSASRLAGMNGISTGSTIYPGQKLKVGSSDDYTDSSSPSYNESSAGGSSYRVRTGDTLWDISRRFGISLGSLLRANSLSKRSVLKPGQTLVIPGGGLTT